jgi:hypothetical protein
MYSHVTTLTFTDARFLGNGKTRAAQLVVQLELLNKVKARSSKIRAA